MLTGFGTRVWEEMEGDAKVLSVWLHTENRWRAYPYIYLPQNKKHAQSHILIKNHVTWDNMLCFVLKCVERDCFVVHVSNLNVSPWPGLPSAQSPLLGSCGRAAARWGQLVFSRHRTSWTKSAHLRRSPDIQWQGKEAFCWDS